MVTYVFRSVNMSNVIFVIVTAALFISVSAQDAPPVITPTLFPTDIATNATVDGKTYFFSKPLVLKNFKDANEICQKYKTELVTIESEAINGQLMKAWKDAGSPRTTTWIGGEDPEGKGTFQWKNGNKPLTWTNWATSQPWTLLNDRRCLSASFSLVQTGMWSNQNCIRLLGFICST